MKFLVIICILAGAYLIYPEPSSGPSLTTNKKALVLARYMTKFKKPRRIEVINLTKRLSLDAEEVRKINFSTNPKSNFYISIDLFTDEKDPEAPLIAQIKFYDVNTQNKLSEENIDLK